MCATLNKVYLIGRLGQDPKVLMNKNNLKIANFSLATVTGFGEKRTVEWHQIVAFDTLANNVEKFLKKGSLIYIEGYLSTKSYKDKNNIERKTTNIISREIQFLENKSTSDSVKKEEHINTLPEYDLDDDNLPV